MANGTDKIPGYSSAGRFSFDRSGSGKIFLLLFVAGALYSFYYAIQGWSGSLLEMYAFRQTQTAITVQHMLAGGPLLKYETPVLGPPWAIPLEFPLYQYLVFLVVKLTGYDLDPAGRLISLLFFISALYPFHFLTKSHFTDNSRVFIALLLLCISPQYLFWSRSFMIESAALSLSLWYLCFIRKLSDRDEASSGHLLLGLILVTGVLASITKITTFFIYYIVGALLLFFSFYQSGEKETPASFIRKNLALLIVALIVPLLSTVLWNHYTDQIKSLNPIGAKLTSAALKQWTFGTMEQKLSLAGWGKALSRSLKDLIGNVWLAGVILAFLPFCRKRTVWTVLAALLLFLLPMAVFTNLYFVHNYYVYANGIFILLALALVIGDLSGKGAPWMMASIVLLLFVSFSSGSYYLQNYYPMQGNQYRYQDIKYQVDSLTGPDDVLVFFGADWSADMPYYLERRALMLPDSLTDKDNYPKALERLKSYRIGGVFLCYEYRSLQDKYGILSGFAAHFPGGFKTTPFRNCDAYFNVKGMDS